MIDNHYDMIIIGSGLGGLLCGYILSREGMRVRILEKNKQAGGALQSFRRKGIDFDTGVHYIGGMDEGQNLNRYFRYFNLTGNLKLTRLNKGRFDLIAIGDKEYPLAQGFDNFSDQLLPFFPDDKAGLTSYIQKLKEIAGAFSLYNLENPSDSGSEELYRVQSAYEYYQSLDSYSHSPFSILHPPESLSSVLAGNNFLYAGNKEKTPLYIPALINHSFISSAWRLTGGSNQVIRHLSRGISNHGGDILTRAEVVRITRKDKRFNVILHSGEQLTAERIIADIHPSRALDLLESGSVRKVYSERIRSLKNTTGSFGLHIVLTDKSFPFLDHNYYYHRSSDVWNNTESRIWPQSYMLHTPAFEETDNFAKSLVIMTFMDYRDVSKWENSFTGRRSASYYEFKEEKANQLLDLAELKFPGLRSKIAFMETSTPLTWRDYTGTPHGSMYGIQRDFHDPSGTLVFPKTKIPGFYFTGQNVNLHGVLGVTVGSVMTCSEIFGYGYLLNKICNA